MKVNYAAGLNWSNRQAAVTENLIGKDICNHISNENKYCFIEIKYNLQARKRICRVLTLSSSDVFVTVQTKGEKTKIMPFCKMKKLEHKEKLLFTSP
jgi:hypothetical protein